MKKILTLAALMAIAAMPATGAFAATAAAPAMSKVEPICYVLPLLPKCMTEWKDAHPMAAPAPAVKKVAAVAAKPAVKAAAPAMSPWKVPVCTPAPAGSAYLYVCK